MEIVEFGDNRGRSFHVVGEFMHHWNLVLASGSPRRRELLENIGIEFQVMKSDIEEKVDTALPPDQLVQELASQKAIAVAKKQPPQTVVIGADTIVVLDGKILGKPKDAEDAFRMLGELSGRSHEVFTGIAIVIIDSEKSHRHLSCSRRTEVWIKNLTPEKKAWYVKTKEPMDKAGAYGIQGYGACLVDHIYGCYFNVVGLSLSLLEEMMEELGLPLFETFGKGKRE